MVQSGDQSMNPRRGQVPAREHLRPPLSPRWRQRRGPAVSLARPARSALARTGRAAGRRCCGSSPAAGRWPPWRDPRDGPADGPRPSLPPCALLPPSATSSNARSRVAVGPWISAQVSTGEKCSVSGGVDRCPPVAAPSRRWLHVEPVRREGSRRCGIPSVCGCRQLRDAVGARLPTGHWRVAKR